MAQSLPQPCTFRSWGTTDTALPHLGVGDRSFYWETLHPSCHHVLHVAGGPILLVREQFALTSSEAAAASATKCAVPSSSSSDTAYADVASESPLNTVLESESSDLVVELVSETAMVRAEYTGVPRYPKTCPDGYSILGRRCVSLTEGDRQDCLEGEEVLVVETAEEMDRVEGILGMR